MLDLQKLKSDFRAFGTQLGFTHLGFTDTSSPETYARYLSWLEQGYQGSMWYLEEETRKQKRGDPTLLLPTAKSVIVGAVSYKPQTDTSMPNDAKIARYAWGLDYHVVLQKKLAQLANWLTENLGPHDFKICVDTAPLLERDLAERAGLGWIGKNTCLINQTHGSYLFLGEILTSHVIPIDEKAKFHCGSCTACLDACPTQAFEAPFVLNAQKCISYHTIENRDAEIPAEIKAANLHWIAGCDICQEVCPWNRKSPALTLNEFAPKGHTGHTRNELKNLNSLQLKELFKDSSLSRIRPMQMKRNLSALGANFKETDLDC